MTRLTVRDVVVYGNTNIGVAKLVAMGFKRDGEIDHMKNACKMAAWLNVVAPRETRVELVNLLSAELLQY